MARFQLCEEDRKRFGGPEWLTFDPLHITITDLEELSERFGFDPTDWPDPFLGEIALEDAGDGAVPRPPKWRNRALAWMLLRQNGIDVSWDDVGSLLLYKMTQDLSDMRVEPGKDSTAAPRSARSGASTTRRSGTSTRSRRKT